MQWEFIVALVIAIPIILFPAVFVWYLNLGWIFFRVRETIRKRKTAREERIGAVADAVQHIAATAIKEQPAEKKLVGTKS